MSLKGGNRAASSCEERFYNEEHNQPHRRQNQPRKKTVEGESVFRHGEVLTGDGVA